MRIAFSSEIYDYEQKMFIRSKLKGNPNFELFGEMSQGEESLIIPIFEENSLEKHRKLPIPFENPVINLRPVLNEKGRYLWTNYSFDYRNRYKLDWYLLVHRH
jgi:hypothetical protein